MTQQYSAFAASPSLAAINDEFIGNMNSNSAERQAPLFVKMLHLFMDEVLDSYFIGPMELVKLNPVGQKVVNAGVAAIRKTSKMAITKVVGKLSNEELKPIAGYIDSIMLRPAPGSEAPTYVAVPISDELYQRLSGSITSGRNNGPHTVTEHFSEAMCDLIDESLNQYFEIPVSMLKLGYLTEKIARVAMESGRSASQTVVRKVAKTMNEKELLAFFHFAESMILEQPAKAA